MKSLLKFITCGSVDDGKSTLIGHMLYDAKLLFADQERALELESKTGSRGGKIDYSLLLDGLMAEREQGITIDVAYRYFTTENRSFIVADTPGHEEYTRNMAVGASFADLAVILIDASKGVLVQTRRHARICSLMGIRHFVFAVNKMDLIHYNEKKFHEIEVEIKRLLAEFEVDTLAIIPVSATEGDNVTNSSTKMLWYQGDKLLSYLENVDVTRRDSEEGFVMTVQRVSRPDHTFRGFQGQVECGQVSVGDEIQVLPSKETAQIKNLLLGDKTVDTIEAGDPVTIQLDREVDVSRGCVLVKGTNPSLNNMLNGTILWMDDVELVEGKNYIMKLGTKEIPATIMNIKYKVDVNTGDFVPEDSIYKNEIANCDIVLGDKIVFEDFKKNHGLGAFILIDRVSHMTSACGIVEHALRRGENVIFQEMDVNRDMRAKQKNQEPATIWFTGLSGSGKSTLANELEKRLVAMGKHTMSLDGDNIRLGINKDLGFKEKDRIENIRRIAEVSKLMNDAGLIVLTSFISPYRRDRQSAREIVGNDSFIEIHVSTPLEECEKRDVKGLYAKARTGEIPEFTGISSPYETPEHAELTVDTSQMDLEESVDLIMDYLKNKGII